MVKANKHNIPSVYITPRQVICPRHGEPFRAAWPAGYGEFAEIAMGRLLSRASIHAHIREQEAAGITKEVAVATLLVERPLCCQFSEKELFDIYMETNNTHNIWPVGRCAACGEVGVVTKSKLLPPGVPSLGGAGGTPDICLHCVCFGCGGK